jgi:hypothetical protein
MPRNPGQRIDAHARVFGKWRSLPAWLALSPIQLSILIEAMRDCGLYQEDWPQKNVIRLTCDQIRKRWHCSHATASKALTRLEACGWIARVGLAPGPTGQAGGVYELLMLDAARLPRSGPFMKWRPNV